MDKEQAQFLLESFRPDGADASNSDFKEALQLAVQDRELGEWLAGERAADSAFSEALCSVEIPEELRQHLLAMMHGEMAYDLPEDEELNDLLHDALEDIQPPEGLREQIISAMEIQEGKVTALPTKQRKKLPLWQKLSTIAATILLGSFLAFQLTNNDGVNEKITSHDIQQEAGFLLNAKFDLDVKNEDGQGINTWLISRHLPTPSRLPPHLDRLEKIGCKELKLPGDYKASLICFMQDSGGLVHLVIIKNDIIKDTDLPLLSEVNQKNCYHCSKTHWNVARWKDSENTFILLAKRKEKEKNEILQYF